MPAALPAAMDVAVRTRSCACTCGERPERCPPPQPTPPRRRRPPPPPPPPSLLRRREALLCVVRRPRRRVLLLVLRGCDVLRRVQVAERRLAPAKQSMNTRAVRFHVRVGKPTSFASPPHATRTNGPNGAYAWCSHRTLAKTPAHLPTGWHHTALVRNLPLPLPRRLLLGPVGLPDADRPGPKPTCVCHLPQRRLLSSSDDSVARHG